MERRTPAGHHRTLLARNGSSPCAPNADRGGLGPVIVSFPMPTRKGRLRPGADSGDWQVHGIPSEPPPFIDTKFDVCPVATFS